MVKYICLVCCLFPAFGVLGGDFSIADYGAKPDDSKSTAAFVRAIDACVAAGGGRVVVPAGRWFTGAIRLKSEVELHLAEGAEVLFSQDPQDYLPAVPTSWEGMECVNYCPLVYAYGCTNVAITGTGTLRAFEGPWEETAWYPWVPQDNGIRAARRQLYDWGATDFPVEKREIWKMPNAHTRPHFVHFNRCRNVRWENFKVRNSPFWTLHLYLCEDAEVRGLDVCAHGNNNDGVDIEMSRNVLIENCRFDQGDDGVVIKSGRNRDAWRIGMPTENVLVRNCHFVDAHTVFGIGSEISGGVRNVRMKNCTADIVYRVFYLKTNHRRGGALENISCENVTCREARVSAFEIATDILYEWKSFPDYEMRRTRIAGIRATNISVGKTKNLVRLVGDPALPPLDVRVTNVRADVVTGERRHVENVRGYVEDGLPNLSLARVRDAMVVFSTAVYDEAFNRVVRADRACDAKWAALKTPDEVTAYQREVREKAVAALGGFPERTPLNARVTGTVEKKGYRVEKVLFESRPDFYVTAHLFVPTDPKFARPYPGIVIPCGHSRAGKLGLLYSGGGRLAALNGLAALVYDPIEQGERHQKRDADTAWSTTGEHNNLGVRAFLLGESAAQVRIWDGLRAIDYLASRTDLVDPNRLGVAGISGGGTLSSYLNAFDPRVRCAAPCCFLSTLRDVYDNCGPQDAEQVIFGQLGFGLNHLGIVSLRAPSPVLVSTAHADFFPFIGSFDLIDNARKVFAAAGKPDAVDLIGVSGEHLWYPSHQHAMAGWMRRWLDGDAAAYDPDHRAVRRRDIGHEYDGETAGLAYDADSVKRVTADGSVLTLPGARSIYDIYREKLSAARASRCAVTPETVRTLTGIRPFRELAAASVPVEAGVVLSRDDDMTPIPVVFAKPATPSSKPPVLVVSDVTNRIELAGVLRRFLDEGRSVAVADVRGFGETSASRHSFYGSKDGDEEIAMCLMTLGDSLVARRAEDVMMAADCVASALGAKPVLHAEGRAVIPAVHAKYLEPGLFAGLEIERTPPSWSSLIADESIVFPFSGAVRGALTSYDWTELE